MGQRGQKLMRRGRAEGGKERVLSELTVPSIVAAACFLDSRVEELKPKVELR